MHHLLKAAALATISPEQSRFCARSKSCIEPAPVCSSESDRQARLAWLRRQPMSSRTRYLCARVVTEKAGSLGRLVHLSQDFHRPPQLVIISLILLSREDVSQELLRPLLTLALPSPSDHDITSLLTCLTSSFPLLIQCTCLLHTALPTCQSDPTLLDANSSWKLLDILAITMPSILSFHFTEKRVVHLLEAFNLLTRSRQVCF